MSEQVEGERRELAMKKLPIEWRELDEEERKRIQECFVPPSMFMDMVRFTNSLVMPRLFTGPLGKCYNNLYLQTFE